MPDATGALVQIIPRLMVMSGWIMLEPLVIPANLQDAVEFGGVKLCEAIFGNMSVDNRALTTPAP